MNKNNFEDLLTVEDVADYLRISTTSVRNYINRGLLKAIKVGQVIRIEESELMAFLDRNCQQGAPEPATPKTRKTLQERLNCKSTPPTSENKQ